MTAPDSPTEVSAGVTLRRGYRVLRKLGQGNMGRVYEAVHVQLGRKSALKQTFYFDEGGDSWFKNEAQLLSRLSHPSLPYVHDYFEEDGSYFLAMDLIDGPSLKTKLSGANTADIVEWIKQVLNALAYMHSKGIVHRDIKPDNIRLVGEKIFLVDFGLAKEMSAVTLVPGHTPDYSAPEQIAGKSNERTDIYSVGATLYHLLTGVRPARSADRSNAFANNLPDPLGLAHQKNRKVPKWLSAIVAKAMAFESNDRFESAEKMLDALNAEKSPPPFSNTQSQKPKGSRARASSVPSDSTAKKQSSHKQGPETHPNLPLPSPGCVGCLLLIAAITVSLWYFWPQTKSPETVSEPQWAQTEPVAERLELTVEGLDTTNGLVANWPMEGDKGPGLGLGKTTLHLAVRNLANSSGAGLKAADGAYLTDSRGTRYDLWLDRSANKKVYSGNAHTLLRNEVYRFNLIFPKIDYQTPFIYLNHPQFQPMKINLKW